MRHPSRLLVLLVALLLALPGAAVAHDAPGVGSTVSYVGPEGDEVAAISVVDIVEPFALYDAASAPGRGSHYVLVELSIENHSPRPMAIDPSSFVLADRDGFLSVPGYVALAPDAGVPAPLAYGTLESGQTLEGVVVVPVLNSSELAQVLFRPASDRLVVLADLTAGGGTAPEPTVEPQVTPGPVATVVPTAAPTAATTAEPSTVPAEPFPTAAEAALLAHIPEALRRVCVRADGEESHDVSLDAIAAVFCYWSGTNYVGVTFQSYPDAEAMDAAYAVDLASMGVTTGAGPCSGAWPAEEARTVDGEPVGRVACAVVQPWTEMAWTDDRTLVGSFAKALMGREQAIYRWAREYAGPIIGSPPGKGGASPGPTALAGPPLDLSTPEAAANTFLDLILAKRLSEVRVVTCAENAATQADLGEVLAQAFFVDADELLAHLTFRMQERSVEVVSQEADRAVVRMHALVALGFDEAYLSTLATAGLEANGLPTDAAAIEEAVTKLRERLRDNSWKIGDGRATEFLREAGEWKACDLVDDPSLASSPSPQPTSTPTAEPFPTEAEAALLAHVPEALRDSCYRSYIPSDTATAAVTCGMAVGQGSSVRVTYQSFADATDMDDTYRRTLEFMGVERDRGSCPGTLPSEEPFNSGDVPTGRLACALVGGGTVVSWTDDHLLVHAYAQGFDVSMPDLHDWWVTVPGPVLAGGEAPVATTAPTPTPVVSATPRPDASGDASLPGVEGSTFQSLTYALNFSWSDEWEVVSASTLGEGQDDLALTNGVSNLYLQTYPFEGTPEECLAGSIRQYEDDPAYSDVMPAVDAAGTQIGGSLTGFMDSAGAIAATYDAGGASEQELRIYISCWTVHVGPDAIGRFTLIAPPDVFEQQIAKLQQILDTLVI